MVMKKPCRVSTCARFVDGKGSYCVEHAAWGKKFDPDFDIIKLEKHRRLYSRRWEEVRRSYLRLHPYCEDCKIENHLRPAREVHHLRALNQGGDRFAWDNLKALCTHHHLSRHNFEQRSRVYTYENTN